MNPTEQLKEEHAEIKSMLQVMENVCKDLDAAASVNPEDLEQIVDFIKVFADKCHHGKEEDLLFVAMEEAGIPKEGGPLGVMLREHNAGRDFVKGMSEAAVAYKAGDRSATIKFAENARGYIALLSSHIDKEDNILYPMADMRLSPEKQAELLEDFERVEEEKIGPGKHEELHKNLHHLREVYL